MLLTELDLTVLDNEQGSLNADDLVKSIKDLRRRQEIPPQISIVRDITNKEIRFFADAGRV
jgi:DNA-directed RNA polymerase II subunit RPB2